jgi:hypothetical protein
VRLDEVVLRALDKTPALRYASASAFKTDVETITMTEQPSGTPPRDWQTRIEPTQRAERIRAAEKSIVLPVRLLFIAIVGYAFFCPGWLDTPGRPSEDWCLRYATYLKAAFVDYAVASAIFGAVLIWTDRFSEVKIQWLVFSAGVLDALMLATLTAMTNGYDSDLYWLFGALILHNAMAIPGAVPQVLLNFLSIGAYAAAGRLDRILNVQPPIMDVESIARANPYERVVVLAAWALCFYCVQKLFWKREGAQTEATASSRGTNG